MIDEKKLKKELAELSMRCPYSVLDDRFALYTECFEKAMSLVKEQPKVGEWIYFTSREADDEEKEMLGFDRVINCKFPENEEEILVLYSDGYVCIDTFMIDGEMVYLDSNSELETQVIAWMPKPTKDGYRMEGM